jgi:membrane fusion protein, heavy metal efflux system
MLKNNFLYLLLVALLACCHHHHIHDDDEHEEAKVLITAYSEFMEVFAEADPFVVGKTSEILAHFTHLETFKPLTDADITMTFGGEDVIRASGIAARPGIYRFQLQPESSGVAGVRFQFDHQGTIHSIEAGHVVVYDNEEKAVAAAEEEFALHPTAIMFTKEQSWTVDFATAEVFYLPVGTVIPTVGEVLPAQGDEITINARAPGMVSFIHSSLYEGTQLQRGELLINISGEGLAEGNVMQRYREAQSNFERARANYQRLSSLAEAQIVSQADLLQARNEFETARAVYENLSGSFSERGQQIRSPENGYLASLFVSQGEFVQSGQPIASVVRNRGLTIRTEVQQRYARILPDISDATVRFPDGTVLSLEQLGGRVLSYARHVNHQNHLLPVHLQIDAMPGMITGALLDVYLKTIPREKQIAVPVSALIEEQGLFFVYVQLHPESFEKRAVRTGQSDGIHTEIVHGLNQGERIVSRGAMLVKLAAASATLDPHSGHVH